MANTTWLGAHQPDWSKASVTARNNEEDYVEIGLTCARCGIDGFITITGECPPRSIDWNEDECIPRPRAAR